VPEPERAPRNTCSLRLWLCPFFPERAPRNTCSLRLWLCPFFPKRAPRDSCSCSLRLWLRRSILDPPREVDPHNGWTRMSDKHWMRMSHKHWMRMLHKHWMRMSHEHWMRMLEMASEENDTCSSPTHRSTKQVCCRCCCCCLCRYGTSTGGHRGRRCTHPQVRHEGLLLVQGQRTPGRRAGDGREVLRGVSTEVGIERRHCLLRRVGWEFMQLVQGHAIGAGSCKWCRICVYCRFMHSVQSHAFIAGSCIKCRVIAGLCIKCRVIAGLCIKCRIMQSVQVHAIGAGSCNRCRDMYKMQGHTFGAGSCINCRVMHSVQGHARHKQQAAAWPVYARHGQYAAAWLASEWVDTPWLVDVAAQRVRLRG